MRQEIKISLPKEIAVAVVKNIIEGNISYNSHYSCKCELLNTDNESNWFLVSSEDEPEVFFYVGMTVSEVLRKLYNH